LQPANAPGKEGRPAQKALRAPLSSHTMTSSLALSMRKFYRLSPGRSAPAVRIVCVLWIAVGMAASVRVVLQPSSHTVFPVFAGGASHWWHDQPLYIDYRPIDYFRYPPFFALFVSPFAALGLRVGGILWRWLGLGVYASGLWRFRREVLPARWTVGREAIFLSLATLAALAGLWNGQSNALLVGLVLWGASALVANQCWEAAAWMALAVSFKL